MERVDSFITVLLILQDFVPDAQTSASLIISTCGRGKMSFQVVCYRINTGDRPTFDLVTCAGIAVSEVGGQNAFQFRITS
jgi:hypothetical protein